MYNIPELQQILDKAVTSYQYPNQPQELYEPVSYLLGLGGKRLRPALLLMAVDAFGGNVLQATKPALAIEFFHNFTLMHDDIMDKAPLRRGKPTVHAKWNDAVAILSGDIMLIDAYKLISQVEASILPQVLTLFNTTAQEVCEGQQFDMNFEKEASVSIANYLNMIRLKTAVLLGGALKTGALIAHASTSNQNLIYDFGVNLGIAFQLQDDILDVYGDPEKFGKQIGGDIISNKKTFLLIKALELAKGSDQNLLISLLENKSIKAESKVEQVTNLYNKLSIKNIAEEAMLDFANRAIESLNAIAIPEDKKSVLKDFATQLIQREH